MNSVALLLALLAVAYIGSTLAGAKGRGQSLVSGVEFVLLGAIIGPQFLALVTPSVVVAFEPLAVVALGWLAMSDGFHCGHVGEVRVSMRRVLQGLIFTTLIAASVATLVGFTAYTMGWLHGETLWVSSVGMGLVSCESTRHAVQWVAERRLAKGSLSRLIAEVSSVDSAVPLPALAGLFLLAGHQRTQVTMAIPNAALLALVFVLGLVLGTVVVVLFKMPLRKVEAWGVLVGTALLGTGISVGTGAAWPATLFSTGIVLSIFVSRRPLLRRRFMRTERAVLLPALLLAGTHLEVPGKTWFFLLIAIAFAAHALVTVVVSVLMRALSPVARKGGPLLGVAMLSSGPLSICVGFACALRFQNIAGQLILATAVADTLLGELVGPWTLRRVLRAAGELNDRGDAAPALAPQQSSPS